MESSKISAKKAALAGNICSKREKKDYTYSTGVVAEAFAEDPTLQIEAQPAKVSKFSKPGHSLKTVTSASDEPGTGLTIKYRAVRNDVNEFYIFSTTKVYNQDGDLQTNGWLATNVDDGTLPESGFYPVNESGTTHLTTPITEECFGEVDLVTFVTQDRPSSNSARWYSTTTTLYVREKYYFKFTQEKVTDNSYIGCCKINSLYSESPLEDVRVLLKWKINGEIFETEEVIENGTCYYNSESSIEVDGCNVELLDHIDKYLLVDIAQD